MFWPQDFSEECPKFLDLRYKIDADSDHVAKFRGDRLQQFFFDSLSVRHK